MLTADLLSSAIQSFQTLASPVKPPAPAQPTIYTCHVLGLPDLEEVCHLQTKVWNALSAKERNYILPQSRDHFTPLLSAKEGRVIGISTSARLQAQGCLLWAQDKTPQGSKMTDCPIWLAEPDRTCVVFGTLVAPEARGHGLQILLHKARLQLALQHNRPFAIGEVAAANVHSWPKALKMGGYITSTGIDETDGCQLLNYTIPLTQHPVFTDDPPLHFSPVEQFKELSAILNTGEAVGTALKPGPLLEVRVHQGWAPPSLVKAQGLFAPSAAF